jgi:hypothetical protein
MDRVIFGDNQFFGVNHMSEERARAQAMRFQDISVIIEVLDIAYREGIRTFMCTTHDRMFDICEYFRKNIDSYPDFKFYPCMPYAHKYANAATEYGLVGALRKFLPEDRALASLFKGGVALASKDMEGIIKLLVDAEMKMFAGLSTPVIFIQNVIADLILGLGMSECFAIFAEHIRVRYKAEPGFITMNLPKLLDALEQQGIDNPIVCSNINKIGFRMCGGMELYESTIATRQFRPIAMSVLASGAISPKEAIEYISHQSKIKSIVFGASSRSNIRQTKSLIDELMK